jgi:sugar O-acyltransferase (sialic acid O-acetyltransferase NeuD family)
MKHERIIVVGASGHAKVVCDVLGESEYEVAGFLDDRKPAGTAWQGYDVLGPVEALPDLVIREDISGGVIGVGDNANRGLLARRVRKLLPDFRFINAIHPAACLARGVQLGEGTVMMAGAVANSGCVVGDHCIINTNASLDHDSVLERYASLAPGAVAGGGVTIGEYSAVSIGAVISHGLTVGAHTVVGAGSVVLRDVPDHVVAYGSPARVIRSRSEGEPYL